MKRYLLFGGADYYPSGGWDDLFGDYDTDIEAIAVGKKEFSDEYLWFQIVDLEKGVEIEETKKE